MTANNNTVRRALSPLSHARLILTRIGSNLQLWIVTLFRKPKARTPRIGVGPIVLLVGLIAVIIASMFLLDAPASEWARQLPPWVAVTGDEISNFALGSRFSYPLGLFILLLAALTRPSLPLSTRGVLEIFAARAGFLFIAIGLPGLFDTVVKRLIGRARPYVGAHDDPFAYKPFIWRPDYASMPSGHSTTAAAAAIAIGAIWPQARPVVWLYALIIMSARVVMNVPSSKRRDRRRAGRGHRSTNDPPLVRGAAAGVLRPRLKSVPGTVLAPHQSRGPPYYGRRADARGLAWAPRLRLPILRD